MSSVVLFVFEGERTEPAIVNSLQRFYLSCDDKAVRKAAYGFNVYKLFEMLGADDGLSLVGLLQEELIKRQGLNEKISADEQWLMELDDQNVISDIYLFFDYDPHCRSANDEQLLTQLSMFNDSMENGALFVSYPMVESLRHIDENAPSKCLIHKIEKNTKFGKNYKSLTAKVSPFLVDWSRYEKSTWQIIIDTHLVRANQLMTAEEQFPTAVYSQQHIFEQQLNQHIQPHNQIAVICAIPLMLHEYYGARLFDLLQ